MVLSRRDFIKASAAATAAATVGIPLAAPAATSAPPGIQSPERWVKSVCRYCGTGCGLFIGVRNGRVVSVKGDKDNHNKGFLCAKGYFLPSILYSSERLLHPMVKRNGTWERLSWDEAMDLVARRFRQVIEQHGPQAVGFYGSGQALTEESYLANKLFKAGIRTNNMDGNPRLCMASAVGGYVTTYGKDEPMGCYEDIDHADVFFLIGSNTAEAHPIIYQRIIQRKSADKNVRVIVADPRRTATARIADLHMDFLPGTDLAILNAMASVILQEGLADPDFVATHTTFRDSPDGPALSLEDYRRFLAAYTPEKAEAISGCSAELIGKAARMFAERGRATMSMWTMGLNQRTSGVAANNLVHNLHLLTGKIGLPGSTPLSLTGQPNACGGVRDGGALSHLLPYGRLIANEKHRREIEQLWSVPEGTIQPKPGLSTVDLFSALNEGTVKALLILCTNPGQSMPNLNKYRKGLGSDDTFVVVSEAFFPTRTAELADVVLPAALWAEKEGVYGCTERRYQLLEKAVEPAGEARPDFAILKDLARRLGHGALVNFQSEEEAWNEIRKVARGTAYDFTGMTRERMRKEHGLLWPLPSEGHPGTKRRYVRGEDPFVPADHPHRIDFYGRPDHRAVIWMRPQKDPAEKPDAEYPFYFTTGRVLEHWHTSTMTGTVPELRRAVPTALAEIHPEDARNLGIATRDRVRISSRRGSIVVEARVVEIPRPGLIFAHMHDRETERMVNYVTNDATDPISRQPEFKISAVRVDKA